MNIKNKYPYPVLGQDDDILPLPSCEASFSKDSNNYIFEFNIQLENEDIMELINNDFADIFCEVDSPKSLFQETFKTKSTHINITIDKEMFKGGVDLTLGVSLKKSLTKYINSGFNEDYKGLEIDLEPGDMLAFLGQFHYDADIKYNKLQAISSMMEIKEDKEKNETWYDIEDQKILIYLPTDMFQEYKNSISLDACYSNMIFSSIVYNALVFALFNYDPDSDLLWTRTLRFRLEHETELQDFDPVSNPNCIPQLAQKLLRNPYKRMFESMRYLKGELNGNIDNWED
jgi:hypothetical protein